MRSKLKKIGMVLTLLMGGGTGSEFINESQAQIYNPTNYYVFRTNCATPLPIYCPGCTIGNPISSSAECVAVGGNCLFYSSCG